MKAAMAIALFAGAALADDRYEVDGRRSGYLYMSAETQGLQDDDFLNPGFFAVDAGRDLWEAGNPSCAGCHAIESMAGVAARYPLWDNALESLINLEGRINEERVRRMGLPALPQESDALIALTAWITLQSRGMPMQVAIDGPAAAAFDQGRAFYLQRRGQLNLSCADCHDARAGQRLRGDVISQGQINAFPVWRLLWDGMGSRHRMFAWCNTALRAEPYAAGSQEYLALELYLAWRGRGLPVEGPGVRR